MTKFLPNFWLTKPIVVMVILIFVSNLIVGCSSSFAYQVRVQVEGTDENVRGARVTLEVSGQAPLDEVTDSNGIARIFIDTSYVGQPGKLIVEAPGYKKCERNIDLTKGTLPKVVQLEKKQSVEVQLNPTPTISPSNTITPTSPTVMPDLTSTNTPEPTLTTEPPSSIRAPRDLNLRPVPSLRARVKDVLPKETLIKIVGRYEEDEPREWILIESVKGVRGWTLLDEDTSLETMTTDSEKFPPVVISAFEDVPTVAVSYTPTPLPPPILISPKTDNGMTFDKGKVVLQWHWGNRTLEKGWFFSVRVGQDEKTGHQEKPLPCFHDKFSFANEYRGDLESCGPGRYYWEVVVAARNEEFVLESAFTKYILEEVEEFTEISEVSNREYFNYTGENPTSPSPSVTLIATDTPVPSPTDTPTPSSTDESGPKSAPTRCQPGRPGC